MIRNNSIKPYQIIAIMGIINFVIMYISGWVVVGTIISGILLLIVGVPLILKWVQSQSPFFIIVSLDPYEFRPPDREHRTRRLLTDMLLGIGDTKLLIYASPRKGTTWDKVNVRFVERKFSPRLNRIWRYEDANSDLIAVSDFRDVIYETRGEIDGRYFEYEPDGVGGYDGIYIPPIHVKGGELVWYDVYVRSNDFWKGYFSFEGVLDNKRAWTRVKAEVKHEHTA